MFLAAPDLTSPEQIQIGTGDDAALVFVHDSNINNIGYSSRILPRNYSDYRDEKFNQIVSTYIRSIYVDTYINLTIISLILPILTNVMSTRLIAVQQQSVKRSSNWFSNNRCWHNVNFQNKNINQPIHTHLHAYTHTWLHGKNPIKCMDFTEG